MDIADGLGKEALVSRWRPQFKLSSWFWISTAVGLLMLTLHLGWHVFVFALGLLIPCFATWFLLRLRRSVPCERRGTYYKSARAMLWLLVVFGWFVAYIVSIAPVTATACQLKGSDAPIDALEWLYLPLFVTNFMPFGDDIFIGVQEYADAWGAW
ncbi:MAG: hypothetical protein R3C10_07300 [Pirellulales bacterium]